ncbi:GNAT family N-acetyltransferase [Thioalkalivibrio sp. XN279]|uniref:GNAT family N-acetyltransferase n=1 Tax=Thioalkalivibrio sp. XN279 TaxID=2714953 RepID=UPI0014091909|nr:GNAT family N-acetyltransferase [Thioalkalivibrio sp. XN279]NHA15463.1 GNAT N-acetyltransferase [Thioalkalivibrio sp. XN279]
MDIRLRPVTREDIDDEYVGWYRNDDGHLDYFTGSGRTFDRDTLVQDFAAGLESGRWFYYLIETGEGEGERERERERVGTLKIGPIDTRNKTADLVALVGNRKFLGQGLATKAIALGNRLAFEKYDIRRLQSGIFATNIPAIKAYTRAGWVVEATFSGFYLRDGEPVDRVCVACFNPRYFPAE